MKIYFENGELFLDTIKFRPDYCCDAKYGYSSNVQLLNELNEIDPYCTIYTNSLVALSNSYSWDKKLERPDIFMRENINSDFKNIEELYNGKIRFAQNVGAMYRSGCFGCI